MRQIDKMTPAELEELTLKGMMNTSDITTVRELREQLAAERNIGWNEGREHERKCNEAQLAAEQKNYALALQMSRIEGKRANEAERQLAAAVEALEVVAENADHYADDYTEVESLRTELRGFAETARAALAKIGGGNEIAEVTVATGIMGDELCQRCGTRFMVDHYCENGHARPGPK